MARRKARVAKATLAPKEDRLLLAAQPQRPRPDASDAATCPGAARATYASMQRPFSVNTTKTDEAGLWQGWPDRAGGGGGSKEKGDCDTTLLECAARRLPHGAALLAGPRHQQRPSSRCVTNGFLHTSSAASMCTPLQQHYLRHQAGAHCLRPPHTGHHRLIVRRLTGPERTLLSIVSASGRLCVRRGGSAAVYRLT